MEIKSNERNSALRPAPGPGVMNENYPSCTSSALYGNSGAACLSLGEDE